MPYRDPTSYSLLTYVWVTVLSSWGGVVSFLNKVQSGQTRPFNLVELIGEIATSAFSGVLTFWGCEAGGLDPLWTAVLVGISGHMGARALFHFEMLVERRLQAVTKTPDEGGES